MGALVFNTNFVKVCVASKSLFPGKRASRTYRISSVDVKPGNPLDNIYTNSSS